MNGGTPLYEIIFFAMIAVFLIFRLRSVLGRRSGHHQERRSEDARPDAPVDAPADASSNDNVIALPGQDKPETEPEEDPGPLGEGYRAIRSADPAFDPEGFVQGARTAFEMVVTAFAAGDRDTLRSLTGDDVLANFETTIAGREAAGHSYEATLIGIRNSDIVDAGLDRAEARVTVRFISEQVAVLRDGDGEAIEGSARDIVEITDIWTFARDTRSPDPNWRLVATASEN